MTRQEKVKKQVEDRKTDLAFLAIMITMVIVFLFFVMIAPIPWL